MLLDSASVVFGQVPLSYSDIPADIESAALAGGLGTLSQTRNKNPVFIESIRVVTQ